MKMKRVLPSTAVLPIPDGLGGMVAGRHFKAVLVDVPDSARGLDMFKLESQDVVARFRSQGDAEGFLNDHYAGIPFAWQPSRV